MLSLPSKIAFSYWHVADSQSGYTAIGPPARNDIDWEQVSMRVGEQKDWLVRLNIHGVRARNVPVGRRSTRRP